MEGKSAHTVPRWPYDFIGPVLKDRPRNLTMCWSLRVIETCRQNNKKRLLAAEV